MWIVFTFLLSIFLFSFSFSNFFQLHAHFVLYLNFRFLSNSILVVLIKAIKYPVSSGTLWLTQKSNCYFDTACLFHTIEVAVHRSNKVAGIRISGKPEKKVNNRKKSLISRKHMEHLLRNFLAFFPPSEAATRGVL